MSQPQTVLLGLGGTGSRVVNNVAKELHRKRMGINDGQIACAVLDTNQADNDLISSSGTTIPVIPTCDERTIDGYLNMYANINPRSWCPYSSSFGAESMIDGASEIRVKSRIAFMDTMNTGKILELQKAIEKIFHHKPGTPEKIRVMLVSSLSGGTGSGMFIQVALWLRKFFADNNCEATIRGIFLLPDIFIRTLPNVRNNPRKKLYHYANAYAAIRELNAINKVIKGKITLERPLVIDGLFDSRKPNAKPVFDNAFFIDDEDANGAPFQGIEDYEEFVAQIVFMQLYAPMHSELTSVEDNLFRAFDSSEDPVFGSCGTAKAEYPVEDIVRYCALRASKDSIADGWNRIDAEIDELIREEKIAELDGIPLTTHVSRRDKFIELFDEKSHKTGAAIGKSDRLFVAIKNDVFDEERVPGENGEMAIEYTDKIESFMEVIDEEIKASVTANGEYKRIKSIGDGLPNVEKRSEIEKSIVETTLKGLRDKEKTLITSIITNFEERSKELADAVVRTLVPLDISSVNSYNEGSLYGLFLKKDPDGKNYHVHPLAARYLLYKLSQSIQAKQGELAVPTARKLAMEGDKKNPFDNPKTRETETLENYWQKTGLYLSKAEIQFFIKAYKKFNDDNVLKCQQYETALLTQMVLKELLERVDRLAKEAEKMFENFPELTKKLGEDIDENVAKNENSWKKILYVFAKREHKEAKYRSLGIDLTGRNNELNEEVVRSIYGKFCAAYRPNIDENKEFIGKSIIGVFREKIVESFTKHILAEYKDQVLLDIISAIKEESDYEYEKSASAEDEKDLFAQEDKAAKTAARHNAAILGYRDRLSQKALPFLKAQPDESLAVIANVDGVTIDEKNEIWMTTADGQILHMPLQTKLTFWGFHPDIAKNYPGIGAALGANKTTAASTGYSQNELCCYNSIYGIKAEAVDKFNEQKNGDYYKHYSAAIRSMIKNGNEVDTPHIDKTWHEFLPYVSRTQQNAASQGFYKAFWRGIAYGTIRLDDHGKYELVEKTLDVYGNVDRRAQQLLEDGRTIGATDISRLVRALRVHPTFETVIIPQLEEEFKKDVTGMTTYISTDIIRGLVRDDDLNPVTMVVRYGASQGYVQSIKSDLVGGLGEVLREVASHYDMNRGDDQINDAKVRLCHRVYEKSAMTKKAAFFESWLSDFKRLGLTVTEDENAEPAVTDII